MQIVNIIIFSTKAMWKCPSLLDSNNSEELVLFIDFATTGLQLSATKAFDLLTGK